MLPSAVPGIATGTILALSRAIGEAAPIIVNRGGVVFITFVPATPFDRFTVLPVQIYAWTNRPQDFQSLAAAAIIVLLVMLLSMNALAVYIRNRFQKRSEE